MKTNKTSNNAQGANRYNKKQRATQLEKQSYSEEIEANLHERKSTEDIFDRSQRLSIITINDETYAIR